MEYKAVVILRVTNLWAMLSLGKRGPGRGRFQLLLIWKLFLAIDITGTKCLTLTAKIEKRTFWTLPKKLRKFSIHFPERQKRSESFLHVFQSPENVRKVFYAFSTLPKTRRKFSVHFRERQKRSENFLSVFRSAKNVRKIFYAFSGLRKMRRFFGFQHYFTLFSGFFRLL